MTDGYVLLCATSLPANVLFFDRLSLDEQEGTLEHASEGYSVQYNDNRFHLLNSSSFDRSAPKEPMYDMATGYLLCINAVIHTN
jgi:hypothetical protein